MWNQCLHHYLVSWLFGKTVILDSQFRSLRLLSALYRFNKCLFLLRIQEYLRTTILFNYLYDASLPWTPLEEMEIFVMIFHNPLLHPILHQLHRRYCLQGILRCRSCSVSLSYSVILVNSALVWTSDEILSQHCFLIILIMRPLHQNFDLFFLLFLWKGFILVHLWLASVGPLQTIDLIIDGYRAMLDSQ